MKHFAAIIIGAGQADAKAGFIILQLIATGVPA